jgi:hypothetical protein
MTRKAKLTAVAAVLALGTGALAASAGPYHAAYDILRGLEFEGTGSAFTMPVTITFHVEEAQSGSAGGTFRAVPTPTAPNADEVQPAPAKSTGCVIVKFGSLTDRGCVLSDVYLSPIDPAFTGQQVSLTYRSAVFEAQFIRVTLALIGEGAITPTVEGEDPSVEGDAASIDARFLIARAAVAEGGFVTSEGLGLTGTIDGTDSARMFTGIGLDGLLDRSCLVALGGVCQN